MQRCMSVGHSRIAGDPHVGIDRDGKDIRDDRIILNDEIPFL